jgi:DNA-directed RNA polymerase specialized sigma24 family protein
MAQPTPVQHPELVTLAVARAKEGDTNALHFLYVRFADDVCGYVNNIVRSVDDSRDITQGVFRKLMTTIQGYEPHEVPFAAWLVRVSRKAALDHLVAREDAQLRQVLLCLQDHRLPRPRQILENAGRAQVDSTS